MAENIKPAMDALELGAVYGTTLVTEIDVSGNGITVVSLSLISSRLYHLAYCRRIPLLRSADDLC